MKTHSHLIVLGIFALALILGVGQAREVQAQGPSPQAVLDAGFTYQGHLNKSGVPLNGTCSFTFSLWDSPSNATGQIGANQTINSVTVTKGLFTVVLNSGNQFGASAFTGQARWLQTTVKCPGDSSPVTLSRQQLTAAPYALFASAPWVTNGNNLSYNLGNVGIGTSSPQRSLHMSGANSRLRLESTNAQLWTTTEYKTDAREWHTGVGGSQVTNKVSNSYYIFDGTASQFRMVVTEMGTVGIGTTTPFDRLEVHGSGPNGGIFSAHSTLGEGLYVNNSGIVRVTSLSIPVAAHLCRDEALGRLSACASAAEYVPSIDSGQGFPETADLVSIAPAVDNPYGDTHAPFTVQKSSTACDPNLLGFIVNPELGADGEKKNEHYLPLAIYGYFPAKVTLENGVIHRGDALTSSSKPGYAMKATSACKIIGYALEDTNQEGTIQVFAEHGEAAIAEVIVLRAQVDALKKQMNALDARLDAIEAGQAPLQGGLLRGNVLLWGALGLFGFAFGAGAYARTRPGESI